MIDLNELEAAINRCAFDGDVLGLSKAECSDMLSRLRQAEKDAARYRWLRDEANGVQIHGCMQLNGEDWNKAIDRVMQCNK